MKKRFISILLIFCFVLALIPIGLITTLADDTILYGDADDSGKVDLEDLLLIERHISGEEVSINLIAADVNADGVVDAIDSGLIREFLVDNITDLTPILHTISFDTDGGEDIPPIQAGLGYAYRGEIPTPVKDGCFFIEWALPNGETYYQNDHVIMSDLTLIAVYEQFAIMQTLNITSFSLFDQPPTVGFDITGDFADVEAVKANLILVPKDGSDPVRIEVLDNGINFTVFAPEGFLPGATYELTLGDGLNFVDKDEMFRTCYFIIAKDEADNLKHSNNVIFIKDTEEMKYTVDGTVYDVLAATLLSNVEGTESIAGTFTMSGGSLSVGDIVCIYQHVHPNDRDYTDDANHVYDDDAIAYLRITSINGIVHGFESLDEDDIKDVLKLPDTIIYKVDQLPTSGGIVNKQGFDTISRGALGQTTAPTFDIDDFLVFYTGDFDEVVGNNYAGVVYGQITSVVGNDVYYKLVTRGYLESFTGMFVYQQVNGQRIVDELTEGQQGELLGSIKEQTLNSGFVEQAGDYMIKSALITDAVQNKLYANGLDDSDIETFIYTPNLMVANSSGSGGKPKLNVEGVSVMPTFIYGKRFDGGIGIKIELCLTLSIDTMVTPTQKTSLKIELSAAFEEEIAVGFAIDIEDKWKGITLDELDVTVSVDIQNYTSVSVGAKIYTVEEEEKQKWEALADNYTGPNSSPKVRDAIRQIDKLASKLDVLMKTGEPDEEGILDKINALKNQLPKVEVGGVEYSMDQLEAALKAEDVSSSFRDVFTAKDKVEAKVGLEQLMDRYTEMINQESSWVELFNKQLFSKEFHVKIVAIRIDLNFIVRAHVNIAIGADIEYEVGKRYTFWVHVFEKEAGSSEIDLIDERFGFQFYIMGTLGLKVGIKAELAVGIISTKIASVGANVEFGPYIKIYGYFVYIYQKLRPANTQSWNVTEEMLGALYIDFGLYITVKFKAQAFDDKFVYEPTLYDGEFPLLTVGARQNVYDFSFQPTKDDVLYIDDEDSDSSNGITMTMPQAYRDMKTIDLVTGQKSIKNYPLENYHITFNDSRFKINNKGVISVDVPDTGVRYIQAAMRIVWKVDKLAFSKYDTDITVPVIWTNMTTTERSEKFNVSVAVGNLEEGYQTIWSDRYSRLDIFDLPKQAEILGLINYFAYDDNGTNLRYGEVIGYQGESTELSVSSDRLYLFDIAPKVYTAVINGVHNIDGTTTDNYVLKTQYGKAFNFDNLKQSGKDDFATSQYTSFNNLTDAEGNIFDLNSVINLEFLAKYGSSIALTANYTDLTKTATCSFVGIISIEPVTIKFKSRTVPNLGDLNAYVRQKAGDDAIITDISPDIVQTEHSINYIVTYKLAEPAPVYYVTFNTKGGEPISPQEYLPGSILFPVYPERAGYTFTGWIYAIDYTPFTFENQKMPSHNLPLFATWAPKEYTITFDPGYGAPTTTKTVVFDEKVSGFPPSPTHNLFRFVGWFDEDSGLQMSEGEYYETPRNTTLKAHWEDKKVFNNSWIICNANQTSDYNKQYKTVNFSMASGYESLKNSIIVEYKHQASDTWTKTKPLNAGGYDVKFTRPGDDNYHAMEEKVVSGAVIIKKIHMVTGGGSLPAPTAFNRGGCVAIKSPDGILGDGAISFTLVKSDMSQIFTNSTGFFSDIPAGLYIVTFAVAEGSNYLSATANATTVNVEGNKNGPYKASIRIITTDGTDAQITSGLYVRTPSNPKTKSHSTILDHGGNDFEAGDDYTYELGGGLVPWGITGGWIFKAHTYTAAPAWSFTSYLRVYGDGTKWSGWVTDYISGNNVGHDVTLEKYDQNFLRRDITTNESLSLNIGNIDLGSTTNYSYSHDCRITDQFMNNYNPMDYVGAPIFSVTSGNPAYDSFIILTGMTSFEIDNKGLAEHIRLFGGEAPKYTISLEYPRNTINKINNVDRTKIEAVLLATNIPASIASNPPPQQTTFARPMSLMLRSGVGVSSLSFDTDDFVLNSGKEFEVPLTISGSTPIWGVLAGIGFDIDVLQLTGVTIGDAFSQEQFTLQNDLNTGTFKFLATVSTLSTIVPDGTLITLSFKIKDDAPEGTTTISVELFEVTNTTTSLMAISDEGLKVIIDNTPPALSEDAEGKTFCEATEFTVVDANIDTVKVNGVEVVITNGKFTVNPAEGEQTIVATDKAGNTTTVTITVNDGHTWEAGEITKQPTYLEDGAQTYTCKFCGATKSVTLPKLMDTTAPTGSISIDTHSWNSFLNTITFGLFFNDTQIVTVSASDAESGIDKTYYYLSDRALSIAEAEGINSWTEFEDSFNIDPNNNFVVYVKITDIVGNFTIINTDGIVLDNVSPNIGGITDGEVYCEAVIVDISDDNLLSVTINGIEVTLTNGKFTVNPAEGEQTIVATDKAGNTTTVTITVNDGHTWEAGEITKQPTYLEDGAQTYTCKFCGATKSVTLPKLMDTNAPTGSISIDTHSWNSFLNTITFGLFFNDTQIVTVSATDGESGIDKTYYYLSDRALSVAEAEGINSWTEFEDSFNIDPNNNFVVYVKITDIVGNFTIINTDGIVLDNVSPNIGGITDGEVYCEAVIVDISDDNLLTVTNNGIEVTLTNGKFTVSPAEGEQTIVATDKAGNTTTVTITVNDGHTWEAGEITKQPTYLEDGAQTFTCKFCGATKSVTLPKLMDTTAPTGSISIDTHSWNSFLNTITFGLFFNDTQTVTVSANDGESGIDKAYYYLSDRALSVAEAEGINSWTEFEDSFNIDPNNNFVVYVKITDIVGNFTIINTDGIVLDNIPPVLLEDADGKTFCEATEFTVVDANIDTVKVNGIEVTLTNGKFTVSPAEGEQTIVATDKAGNTTTVTITVNDGHTWEAGEITKQPTYLEDGAQTYTCKFCGATKSVTLPKLMDTNAPTGSISIDTHSWNSFLNTITFGLFFNDTQIVTVSATDGESGIDKTYYYLSDRALSVAEAEGINSWTEFEDSFNIDPNNNFVVYVKITDIVGNFTIINTEGIVLDNVSPNIGGITDGEVYCEAVIVDISDDNLLTVTNNGVEVTLTNGKFTVSPAEGEQTIVATDKAGNTTTVTITVNDGHTWEAGEITKQPTYLEDGAQTYTCKFCGATKSVTLPKLMDTTAPTGSISIDTHSWNSFLNTITFGLFFNDTQIVTVSANDGESGIDKAYYYLSDRALSIAEAEGINSWTEFEDSFNIDPNNNFVVYVKITDIVGNFTIINTDGIVLDNVSPNIGGITDGEVYCEAVIVDISDDNLLTVTNNGIEVTLTNGKFTVSPAEGEQTIVATDKAGNTTTVTITVNDGHTWEAGEITKQPTYLEDGAQTYTCKFCGATKSVTLPKLMDTTAPTGSISIDTHSWNSFLNTITFGLFFNDTQIVTVSATDGESGIDKAYYYLSDRALSIAEAEGINSWTEFEDSFNIDPNNNFVVYVKITDIVGNFTIINTDGIVLDNVSPNIGGITDGEVYCEAVIVDISDDNLLIVTINGIEVTLTNGKFTVNPAEGEQTIVATDKAGNTTTVTITVNDGHTWDEGVVTTEPTVEQDGVKTYTCKHCGVTKTEPIPKLAPSIIIGDGITYQLGTGGTITFGSNAAFSDFISVTVDGTTLNPTNYNLSAGSINVELKEEYLETLTVGTHTLGIVSASGTAVTEFTIKAKEQEEQPPNVGDNNNLLVWFILLLVSGVFVAIIPFRTKVRRRLVK